MVTIRARHILIPSLVGNRVICPPEPYVVGRGDVTEFSRFGFDLLSPELALEQERVAREHPGKVVIAEVYSNQRTTLQIHEYVAGSEDDAL